MSIFFHFFDMSQLYVDRIDNGVNQSEKRRIFVCVRRGMRRTAIFAIESARIIQPAEGH
jgi:hypothetical protein